MKKTKLSLRRESVQSLTDKGLQQVGGGFQTDSVSCVCSYYTCNCPPPPVSNACPTSVSTVGRTGQNYNC
jgi:hypothetical protein